MQFPVATQGEWERDFRTARDGGSWALFSSGNGCPPFAEGARKDLSSSVKRARMELSPAPGRCHLDRLAGSRAAVL